MLSKFNYHSEEELKMLKARKYTQSQVIDILARRISNYELSGRPILTDNEVDRLNRFINGEKILVESEEFVENGIRYQDLFYSDGTVEEICFGWAE